MHITCLIPESMVSALSRVKLLGAIKSNWDDGDIAGATFVKDLALSETGEEYTERDKALGNLYFWTSRLQNLLGCPVVPDPEFALSAHIARMVNAAWLVLPDLFDASTAWCHPTLKTTYMDASMRGPGLAHLLASTGTILDPDVMDNKPKEALRREMLSIPVIDGALARRYYGVLRIIADSNDDAKQYIYRSLAEQDGLCNLVTTAAGSVSSSMDQRFHNRMSAAPIANAEGSHTQAMSSKAARYLLRGMAEFGHQCNPEQVGWASGTTTAPLDAEQVLIKGALTTFIESVMGRAVEGLCTDGYQDIVRDIGQITGYGPGRAGEIALVHEFAGGISLELIRLARSKWPPIGWAPNRDPGGNKYIKNMMSRNDSPQSASFLDGLLAYLVASRVDPQKVLCQNSNGARFSLHDALVRSMPEQTIPSYDALLLSAVMGDVIANSVRPGVEDSISTTSSPVTTRRRRMTV